MNTATPVTIEIVVEEASQVGGARRTMAAAARGQGMGADRVARWELIATELATNLVRHGGGGRLLVTHHHTDPGGWELLAIDRGPGMRDPHRSLEDGVSTGGTSGTGLGAVRRAADAFALWSRHGQGCVVMARMGQTDQEIAVLNLPFPGETCSGDGWAVAGSGQHQRILMADGLGHGLAAARASAVARQVFLEQDDHPPEQFLDLLHSALRGTRGAAVACCRIAGDQLEFCGVGNIAAVILAQHAQHAQHLVSMNGTVGHVMPSRRGYSYALGAGDLLVLHSDGLLSRWSLDPYPGLHTQHPAIIAAVLLRDFRRVRDDVCVLVRRTGR